MEDGQNHGGEDLLGGGQCRADPAAGTASAFPADLARVGAAKHADGLLDDLTVLGVRTPGPAQHRAALAEDTALTLELTADAAAVGVEVPMPDALCAAAAHRLGLPLFTADLVAAEHPA